MRPESSFWIVRNDVIVKYFDVFFVPLVKFNYWSKFHVNIITGSGVMTLSFYKRLTRNRKYPRLSFTQYLESEASKEYQIRHERFY